MLPHGQVPVVSLFPHDMEGVNAISINRLLGHVATLTFDMSRLLEAFSKLALDALNRGLAARMAGNYTEEQEWAQRCVQYAAAHALLRRMMRSLELVMLSLRSTIKALKLKQLRSCRRQSPNAQFVDGLVASVPVPPTHFDFAMGSTDFSEYQMPEAISYVFP